MIRCESSSEEEARNESKPKIIKPYSDKIVLYCLYFGFVQWLEPKGWESGDESEQWSIKVASIPGAMIGSACDEFQIPLRKGLKSTAGKSP